MKLKSQSMHFEIMRGTTKPSAYIRNSYREEGKVKHQTISRINGLSLEQLQNMKAAFDGEAIRLGDMTFSNGREYGASAMLYSAAKKIGLDKLIYSRNEPWVHMVLAMVIGRIVFQRNSLALSRVSEISCLWEICGVYDAETSLERHCFEAMDRLLEHQQLIQKKLASKHAADGAVIFNDITDSVLGGEDEGEDEGKVEGLEIVRFGQDLFGRNQGGKRRKRQVMIRLLCTKDGCPIAVDVSESDTGNRLKARAFLFMLSCYLMWYLNKMLAPLYAESPDYDSSYVLEIMKSLQKCRLMVAGISTEFIAEPTEIQHAIQKLVR